MSVPFFPPAAVKGNRKDDGLRVGSLDKDLVNVVSARCS